MHAKAPITGRNHGESFGYSEENPYYCMARRLSIIGDSWHTWITDIGTASALLVGRAVDEVADIHSTLGKRMPDLRGQARREGAARHWNKGNGHEYLRTYAGQPVHGNGVGPAGTSPDARPVSGDRSLLRRGRTGTLRVRLAPLRRTRGRAVPQ